jgi:phosphonate transport system substrate-binding protein
MGFLGAIVALVATSLQADSGQSVQAQSAFKLGIAPHTSARVILEMYQPLRIFLEKSLGLPVEVVTATDFTEFAKRMVEQEYDIAVTTGHQARLAQTDGGYAPLLTYQADFRAVALVAGKGPIRSAKDLQGKPVLGLSPSSLVTLWGQRWMKQNGLGSTPIRYVSASDSVAQLVLNGEASAAFTSLANYQKLPSDMQSQLRFLAISEPMAGRVYVLNRRRAAIREKVEAALWAFADSAEGRSYFEKNKLDGYRKLRPKELEAMDPFAADVRQVLKQGGK